MDELCRIDSSLEGLREHLKAADLSLQEVSYALRDYLGRLEANPGRLEEVETRLAAIDHLKRKYGQSIAEMLAFPGARSAGQIAAVEHAGERMEELRREQQAAGGEFEKLAAELTARRAAAARKLEKTRGGGTGAACHGAARCSAWRSTPRLVAARRRPRGIPGFAQPRRRAAAAGEGGFGRRDIAHRAGVEDVPGGAPEFRRSGAHAGVRRSGRRRGRQRGRRRGTASEETGRRQPGAVRDAPAADRLLRRPSLPRGEARIARAGRWR